jgi:hypothetical protein
MVAGWELMIDKKIVVVKEVRTVKKDNKKSEVLVVHCADGKEKEYVIVREDTKKNSVDLEGSEIGEDEKDVPYKEVEIEEEVDES